MQTFSRMKVDGQASGTRKGGRNFLSDFAAFPKSSDNDFASLIQSGAKNLEGAMHLFLQVRVGLVTLTSSNKRLSVDSQGVQEGLNVKRLIVSHRPPINPKFDASSNVD